mmetsp:Transcript_22707/g.67627  ORF Transcript_22707/g.67627 Transcript_22707/m.67627 type:complete len:85 (+) Transcript_22707:729-983(+)
MFCNEALALDDASAPWAATKEMRLRRRWAPRRPGWQRPGGALAASFVSQQAGSRGGEARAATTAAAAGHPLSRARVATPVLCGR